jgi:hypothetical protein
MKTPIDKYLDLSSWDEVEDIDWYLWVNARINGTTQLPQYNSYRRWQEEDIVEDMHDVVFD